MSDPHQFRQKLLAIFADEAREHLRQIEAGLFAFERGEAGALAEMLKALHTLKGAARAVDLDALERLCHALEGLCGALQARPGHERPGAPEEGALDRLHQALSLARELADRPSGRVRNQAAALCVELDATALRLERIGQDGPPALQAARPEDARPAPATPQPDADADAAAPQAAGERALSALVRVRASQLDAIRAEAEALLTAELRLQHEAQELRALAAMLARRRRDEAGAALDAELGCAQRAQALAAACHSLSGIRKRLMEAVLETALVPFGEALDELPALVRKLARSRGVEATLTLEGEQVQLDRRVLGVVREALLHLVANAVDHGIEPPAARAAAGKPPAGAVRLSAVQTDARHVLVRVADDGGGIDTAALARAAGVAPGDAKHIDRHELAALAVRAGVSSRAEVTPVSGRGMGLAIVADKLAALGGTLTIENLPGRGCAFELRVPVSLASLRALVVAAGGQRYAVPLAAVESVRAAGPDDVGAALDRESLLAGGQVVPLVRLATLCGASRAMAPAGVALLAAGARPFALLVDEIHAEQDVLPRELGPLLRRVRFFSGATQLGDGTLVPVLALDDIAAHALGAAVAPQPASPASTPEGRCVLVVEDSITSRLLLKHILEGAGCRVDTAADGLEALSRLRQERYDAVVSDVEMPRLDGLALTESIRADPRTAELPVILVTSLQTADERERGLRAGADAYLTKGAFDQDQLLAALRRLT
jgi:two-component system chemotaxis sensor kinase CheA